MKEGGAFGGAKTILHSEDSHDSVVGNVKNVQGWRGGAERGFLGSYTDIIHQICSNQQFPELSEWYTKVSLVHGRENYSHAPSPKILDILLNVFGLY